MRVPATRFERTRNAILRLRSRIAGGVIPHAGRSWQGAGVVIASCPQPEPMPGSIEAFYGVDREIVTSHRLELSWVFERLRDAVGNLIDGCSKLEFYGRLELAANCAIANDPQIDAAKLCGAVVTEALVVLTEMAAGTFDYLLVAPGGVIKADFGARWN